MVSIKPKKLTDEGKGKAGVARTEGNAGEAESEWRNKMEGRTVIKSKDKKSKTGAISSKQTGTGFMVDSKMMSNRYKRADKKTHEGR